MTDANHNGVDDELEAEYSRQATSARFKQQFAYGVGAAMVFGLFSGVTGYLFSAVTSATAATAVLPILGLVAMGLVGVSLLYLSAKYLSENVVRDQALQARQIGAVTKGKVKELEPEIQQPTSSFPSPTAMTTPDAPALDKADAAAPATRVTTDRQLADTIVARGAANENSLADADRAHASWEAKAASASETPNAMARA